MRKYIYIAILLLLCAGRASAQFTLVSGTVTDVNGLAYACGTISASIVNNNGQSLYLNGVQFSPQPGATKLGCATDPQTSSTPGGFSLQLADNTQIKCGSGASIVTCATQTQWLLTANSTGILPPSGTGPQSCTSTVTISGSSQTVNLLTCPALALAAGNTIAGNANSIYVSPTCPKPSGGNCFFCNDNLQFVLDASWTAATPTAITCGVTPCNFTAADNNKTCYGIAPNTGVQTMQTGVLTVTGTQTATCSAGATFSQTNNGTFAWDNEDTANLNAAYAAVLALPHCGTLVMPTGFMGFGASILNAVTPAGCNILDADASGVDVTGQGYRSTHLVFRPDTVWTANSNLVGCTNCVNVIYNKFQITGLGANLVNGNANTVLAFPASSAGSQIAVTDILGASTPLNLGGQEDSCVQCFVNGLGTAPISANAPAGETQTYEFFGSSGIVVQAGTSHYDFGGVYTNRGFTFVPNSVSGQFYAHDTSFFNTNGSASNSMSIANANAVFDCTNCVISDFSNAGSQAISWTAAGKVYLRGNTQVTGGATAGALLNTGVPGATIYADPTVVFSPVAFPNFTGNFTGPSVRAAGCTGTPTANATINLFASMNITGTCTSVVTVVGVAAQQVGATGALSYLNCTSTAAGVNAGDGVCTVMKNGVATTLTCTIGTGTSCRDNTHSATYAVNDIISIQVVTAVGTTLANLRGSVLTL